MKQKQILFMIKLKVYFLYYKIASIIYSNILDDIKNNILKKENMENESDNLIDLISQIDCECILFYLANDFSSLGISKLKLLLNIVHKFKGNDKVISIVLKYIYYYMHDCIYI